MEVEGFYRGQSDAGLSVGRCFLYRVQHEANWDTLVGADRTGVAGAAAIFSVAAKWERLGAPSDLVEHSEWIRVFVGLMLM